MDNLEILGIILTHGPQVVTIASAISALIPVPPKTNRILYLLSSILNIFALNVGEAKKVQPPEDSK